MRIKRKQIFLTIISFAALLFLLRMPRVSGQVESEGDKATKKFLDNVVQLNVHFSNGKNDEGFGFVVGERDELLYVVTANHVVRRDDPDIDEAKTTIEARFYSDQGNPKKAKLLKLSAGQVDLALLEVPKPFSSYRWETNYFSSPQQNSTVWFIGRDEEWWVPADNEAGIIKELPILPAFPVRIGSVLPGTSGAPLISKEGIIGMIIKDDNTGTAEALDIETIRRIVTLKWNYPWGGKQGGGNILTPDPAVPTEVKAVESKGGKVYKNEKGFWEADYGDGIKMVYIPAGEFTMGSVEGDDDEKPPHKVYLDGYWMGKYEVTFDQYDKYCDETKKEKADDRGWGRGKRPVIKVSWEDAVAYCQWLSGKKGINFKLPTEAQWEKAARGTDSRKYTWGDSPPSGNMVNFADKQLFLKDKYKWADNKIDDGYAYTAPVGSYPKGASPYGLLDMAGNVWEWCGDWYKSDYYKDSPKKNPTGPISGSYRVLRGGGWGHVAGGLRCAVRGGDAPAGRSYFLGFRLSQDI